MLPMSKMDNQPIIVFCWFWISPQRYNHEDIFQVKIIFHSEISVEEPYKRKVIVQCKTCQSHGNTQSYTNQHITVWNCYIDFISIHFFFVYSYFFIVYFHFFPFICFFYICFFLVIFSFIFCLLPSYPFFIYFWKCFYFLCYYLLIIVFDILV